VARRGGNSITSRAVVPARRKAALLGHAVARAVLPPRWSAVEPLAQARFLIAAVAAAPPPPRPPARPSGMGREQVVWVLDLFERLARQERIGGGNI
jgi:phytoene synthase